MTSPLWRHPVTWRHRDHVQSIAHGHILIGCSLEPSRYLASFPRYLAPKFRQRLLRDDVINDVIRPVWTIREEYIDTSHRGTRRSTLKKNHDVTIMKSSGHVTSSGSCPIDRSWPLCYRLSIGTILLCGFVSEIFSAKFTTTIITWWRYQQLPSWIWWNRKYVQSIRRPRKPYPGIKHEVDRTIRCRDMAILNAKFDDVINDITRPGSKIREEE